MPLIKSSIMADLKRRADIIKIASRFTQLTTKGEDHWGRCPFPGHKEKTASFKVSRGRGNFYCFGCKEHGDAVDLVMKLDGVAFPEAVEFVAHTCGIEIEFENGSDNRHQRSLRGQIFEAHEMAQIYFREKLNDRQDSDARMARRYIRVERGFKPETSIARGLGFAPTTDDGTLWNTLSQKFGPEVADQTGLFFAPRQPNQPRRLRWSGRLMVPIHDRQGRLCAYTGRSIPDIVDETSLAPSKYVNSPNTPIFNKGEMLFNWNRAWKNPPPEGGRLIFVEGQLDTIRMDEIGCPWTVAPQGSAVTEEQIQLIANYPAGVLVLLDGDNAGRKGALKFLQGGLKAALDMRFVVLNRDEDPDSLFRDRSPEDIAELLQGLSDRSMSPMLAAVSTKLLEYGEDNPAAKQHIADDILGWLRDAQHHVQAYEYLKELAKVLDVDFDALWLEYKKPIPGAKWVPTVTPSAGSDPDKVLQTFEKADRLVADGQTLDMLSPEEKAIVVPGNTVAGYTSETTKTLTKAIMAYKALLEKSAYLSSEEVQRIQTLLDKTEKALDAPTQRLALLSKEAIDFALATLTKAEKAFANGDTQLIALSPKERSYIQIQPAKITGTTDDGAETLIDNPNAGSILLTQEMAAYVKRALKLQTPATAANS